jgi:hypothetical protein
VTTSAYVWAGGDRKEMLAGMRTLPGIIALVLMVSPAFPALLPAQADSTRTSTVDTKSVLASPRLGINNVPTADTATHRAKEYHGTRWTRIGAVAGGLITGGLATYVSSVCATGGDCRGVWKYIVIATGAGAFVGAFLTGLVYGLFNG